MFKLVVLCGLLAVASAAPGHLGYAHAPLVHAAHAAVVHEPVVAKVGAIVESVPSAVSHQSSTVVHSHDHIVTPVVAPAVKTYVAPVAHHAVHHAPLVTAVHHAPVLSAYHHAPLVTSYHGHHGFHY